MKISSERLALTQVLHALAIDYWHDVDTNWGRNAPNYYAEDGVFEERKTHTRVGKKSVSSISGARTAAHAP